MAVSEEGEKVVRKETPLRGECVGPANRGEKEKRGKNSIQVIGTEKSGGTQGCLLEKT